MNVTLRMPTMTRGQFLDWAERQEAPYEFEMRSATPTYSLPGARVRKGTSSFPG